MLQPLRQKIRIQKNNYWVSDKNVIKNDKISLLLNDISLNLNNIINSPFNNNIYYNNNYDFDKINKNIEKIRLIIMNRKCNCKYDCNVNIK